MTRSLCRLRRLCWIGVPLTGFLAGPALAQKNSGPLLPLETPRAAPLRRAPTAATPPLAAQPGRDPAAEQLSRRLPLDPETRDMRDRLPADPIAVERRLGLHPARGPVADLRGHTPSPTEIADALAPR